MKPGTHFTLTLLFFLGMSSLVMAQGDKSQRPSPPATATGKIGTATVTIQYNSPSVKGRAVWGELVPYGKVWRAGANEATTFETDQAIQVGGKSLPAGKYTLFAIPEEKQWTFIFNSQTGQWGVKRTGEANLDRANDVLTVTAKPKAMASASERLLYEVTPQGFTLKWATLEVPVSLKE